MRETLWQRGLTDAEVGRVRGPLERTRSAIEAPPRGVGEWLDAEGPGGRAAEGRGGAKRAA